MKLKLLLEEHRQYRKKLTEEGPQVGNFSQQLTQLVEMCKSFKNNLEIELRNVNVADPVPGQYDASTSADFMTNVILPIDALIEYIEDIKRLIAEENATAEIAVYENVDEIFSNMIDNIVS